MKNLMVLLIIFFNILSKFHREHTIINGLDIKHSHEMGEASNKDKSMPNGMIIGQFMPSIKNNTGCINNSTKHNIEK